MEDLLSLDNILETNEIENLFVDDNEEQETSLDKEDEPLKEKEKNEEETTEVVDVEDLFTEKPESVGSEENRKEKEDTTPRGGTSPNNFYSSIAKAFAEEGIFPDLNEESINKIKSPEDLRDLVENQIRAGLEERQRRIDEALNAGVEPTVINQYENVINSLNNIEDSAISDESEKGETLRKQLIYQDFINRGYSKERAQREIKKSFDAGTDIEDAKEALESNISFFQDQYNNIIENTKEKENKEKKKREEQAENLRKSILEDGKVFGDIDIDKPTRQKVYDNISKPIYRDPESGELLTAIQKYELENKNEFLKNLGIVFTLTDGFKDLNSLLKGKVKKEVKKGLRELEHTLNNTARTSGGSINYASGVGSLESYIGKGVTLDI